ncbi:murein L,D-transpeptidase catalytic domain family protein [Bdellovibrio sp. KM01]|uniref:murein L,D-transpeptidase catalytic domain family protein n=1 Tax=Bdellovibrio sp. KM01 TaxID=2748865 RepID=UPI002102D151|nr:murein L,D-transpeptidase catalytic domain family protein [Bdellovibrio sp. KM01]
MLVKKQNSSVRSRATLFFAATLLTLGIAANAKAQTEPTLPDDPAEEQVVTTPAVVEPMLRTMAAPDLSISAYDKETILMKYDHVDPKNIVPTQALIDALIYFEKNKSSFKNQNYISIINFSQSSKTPRFYIIDLNSGGVWPIHVAHGKNSDPNHDGFATSFSNTSGSNKSSLGFYRTAETYSGSHGLSLRLDGLSSTNSNARSRAIVIHGASYVQEKSVIQGRSWGCPAVDMSIRTQVINALKGGSLIYAVLDKGGTGLPAPTNPEPTPTPSPTPIETPAPSPTPAPGYTMAPLAWESSAHPERKQWSQYLQTLVLGEWSSLLKGASDMKNFCPKYSSLNDNQKANAWAQLFVAVARYESAYNPLSRMHETTMGTDAVTKKPVYSEGLLQLSYQDIQWDKWCKFDWSKDKNLSSTSPKKTILDPYINLHCGVGIMAKQIKNKNTIAITSGVYWSTLKPGGKYNQLTSIKSMVKSLPFCQ